MAISFAFDGDDVVWTQRLERPAVYLDTFAIREIADSDELSARFARALKSRGGTWLLASLTMGEFARFTDELGHLATLGGAQDLRELLKDGQRLGHFAVALLDQLALGFQLFDFRIDGLKGGQGQGATPS